MKLPEGSEVPVALAEEMDAEAARLEQGRS